MASEQEKQNVLARIESLWEDAAAIAPAPSSPPPETTETPEQPGDIMARINRLMYEAEEIQFAANDRSRSDSQQIADLALDITRKDDPVAPEDGMEKIGSMVMEAASSAPAPEAGNFDDIRSKMEDVSRLQPPQTDNRIPDNPEYAFGVAFSNLVRHVVREYIESDFEPVLRNAIRSEIENHLGGKAGNNTVDADGGND